MTIIEINEKHFIFSTLIFCNKLMANLRNYIVTCEK